MCQLPDGIEDLRAGVGGGFCLPLGGLLSTGELADGVLVLGDALRLLGCSPSFFHRLAILLVTGFLLFAFEFTVVFFIGVDAVELAPLLLPLTFTGVRLPLGVDGRLPLPFFKLELLSDF